MVQSLPPSPACTTISCDEEDGSTWLPFDCHISTKNFYSLRKNEDLDTVLHVKYGLEVALRSFSGGYTMAADGIVLGFQDKRDDGRDAHN